jgi:hypothetical protein
VQAVGPGPGLAGIDWSEIRRRIMAGDYPALRARLAAVQE